MKGLLLDCGNTQIKYRRCGQGESSRVQTLNLATSEDFAQLDRLNVDWIGVSAVKSHPKLDQWLAGQTIRVVQAQTQSRFNELQNAYVDETLMGVDRWLAMIAARYVHHMFDAIVLDMGTATTVDLLQNGQHKGGYIVPGVQLSADALFGKTEKVTTAGDLDESWVALGRSTKACVYQGLNYGQVALVKQLIRDYSNHAVLLTGGYALGHKQELINELGVSESDFYPNLVLDGLELVCQQAVNKEFK